MNAKLGGPLDGQKLLSEIRQLQTENARLRKACELVIENMEAIWKGEKPTVPATILHKFVKAALTGVNLEVYIDEQIEKASAATKPKGESHERI